MRTSARLAVFGALTMVAVLTVPRSVPGQSYAGVHLAAAPQSNAESDKSKNDEPRLSPAEMMQRRHPQPVKVGDLIGLPMLDWRDSTIGFVQDVVRTPDGAIQLIVPYSARFGWLRASYAPTTKRLVAVPLEKVAILGRQIAAVDMSREDFDAAATWKATEGGSIAHGEQIKIAVTRR